MKKKIWLETQPKTWRNKLMFVVPKGIDVPVKTVCRHGILVNSDFWRTLKTEQHLILFVKPVPVTIYLDVDVSWRERSFMYTPNQSSYHYRNFSSCPDKSSVNTDIPKSKTVLQCQGSFRVQQEESSAHYCNLVNCFKLTHPLLWVCSCKVCEDPETFSPFVH